MKPPIFEWTCNARFIKLLKLNCTNVILIKSNVEFALHFRTRTLGISQEFDEFFIATSIKTLSNVVHDRSWCPLYLILQTEIAVERTFGCGTVNHLRKLSPQLPRFNLLKTLNFHETIKCQKRPTKNQELAILYCHASAIGRFSSLTPEKTFVI